MALTKITSITCWICGKEVSLGDCKIDEHGHAVHDECYVMRMKFEAEAVGRTPATDPAKG